MSFGLYAIGFAVLIGGLIYPGYLVHMPGHWIAVGAIVLLGIGILTGVKATRGERASRIAVRRNLAFLRILQVFSTIREFTVA